MQATQSDMWFEGIAFSRSYIGWAEGASVDDWSSTRATVRHDLATLESLRHAFASRFIQATADIPALQAILGHRSIQMTMRHARMVTQSSPPGDGRFLHQDRHKNRHSRNGIARHSRRQLTCNCLKDRLSSEPK